MVTAALEIFLFYVSETSFIILQMRDKSTTVRYIITILAVFLFENLSQGIFDVKNLNKWTFIYNDVNVLMILYWTSVVLVSVAFVDYSMPHLAENKRFFFHVYIATIAGIISEVMFFGLNVRSISPEINEILSGINIFGNVPIEILFYMPLFMILIISFRRYWEINYIILPRIVNKPMMVS